MKVYVMLLGNDVDVNEVKKVVDEAADKSPSIIPMYGRWEGEWECVAFDTVDVCQFLLGVGMKPKIVLFNNVSLITDMEIMVDLFTSEELELILVGNVGSAEHLQIVSLALDCGLEVSKLDNILWS